MRNNDPDWVTDDGKWFITPMDWKIPCYVAVNNVLGDYDTMKDLKAAAATDANHIEKVCKDMTERNRNDPNYVPLHKRFRQADYNVGGGKGHKVKDDTYEHGLPPRKSRERRRSPNCGDLPWGIGGFDGQD